MTSPTTAKVLVADDDSLVRGIVRDILAEAGFRVREAGDGREALEIVRCWEPHIAVLDVLMPGLDGREVCRKIRSDPERADLLVVLLTALDESEAAWQEAGADAFRSKSRDIRKLPETLRRLRGRRGTGSLRDGRGPDAPD